MPGKLTFTRELQYGRVKAGGSFQQSGWVTAALELISTDDEHTIIFSPKSALNFLACGLCTGARRSMILSTHQILRRAGIFQTRVSSIASVDG